jgi:uncharacterized protein (DUF433 family)
MAQASNFGRMEVVAHLLPAYDLCMLDWTHCSAVERSPDKGGGEWLFKGTRIPVRALFENLEDGATTDDFLQWFPPATPEQVQIILRHEMGCSGMQRLCPAGSGIHNPSNR